MSIHNIPCPNIRKKIILNYPKSAAMGFFLGTQERVRNSHGKRAISVVALLFYVHGKYLRSCRDGQLT